MEVTGKYLYNYLFLTHANGIFACVIYNNIIVPLSTILYNIFAMLLGKKCVHEFFYICMLSNYNML